MREIKFRARHKETGEWFYGSSLEIDNSNPDNYLLPLGLFWYQVERGILDRNTVGEHTGLKDKNGVEIYEGDRIKDTDSEFIGEVIWDNDTPCFTTKFQSNELWGFVPRHGKDNHCEVIGNIYENPKLLKGQDNG